MNEAATIERPASEVQQVSGGLEVRSIAKSYDRRAVLHDVSLDVHRGEVVGLLGPNGAGKTTCFYSVMGLVKPDSGRIFLDGRDITELPMYRRAILGLGYLPQETSIFRGLTVEENILAVLEVAEPDRHARRERLERLLGEFGLTALRDSAAMALSGGERRRCEIARALAAEPSIMLLDEPFAGIDPISIADIRELVRELKSRGNRRAHHRPQCPRDARHRRPRLHHLRRPGAVCRHPRSFGRRPGGPAPLPRRKLRAVTSSNNGPGPLPKHPPYRSSWS